MLEAAGITSASSGASHQESTCTGRQHKGVFLWVTEGSPTHAVHLHANAKCAPPQRHQPQTMSPAGGIIHLFFPNVSVDFPH